MDGPFSKMLLAYAAQQVQRSLARDQRPTYEVTVESVSTIYLDVGTKRGGRISSASGALVRCGEGPIFLVTNRHVVTGLHQDTNLLLSTAIPDELLAVVPAQDSTGALQFVLLTLPLIDDDWRGLWFEHPRLGAKADIVALRLPKSAPPPVQMFPFTYDVAKPHKAYLAPAETVSVVGFPFGKSVDGTAVWATGFLASEPAADFEDMPVMLIDCRSREGQSGSPVLFSRQNGIVPTGRRTAAIWNGRVTDFLGIYSGRISDQSDLGRVWKSSAVAELVTAAAEKV